MEKTFISTGIYTNGCIIPVTTEDPCIQVILDSYSEDFRLNIYVGSAWIEAITMSNYRSICTDVSALPVYSSKDEYLGNVWKLIQEQLFWDMLRIHAA
jgi:hypothetical protein